MAESTEELLRRFQRVASTGTIEERLALAARLAAALPSDRQWAQTLVRFEEEYLRKLAQEAKTAVADGDVAKLAALQAAVEQYQWRSPYGAELLGRLILRRDEFERAAARARLGELLAQLAENPAGGDDPEVVAQCREVRTLLRQYADLEVPDAYQEVWQQRHQQLKRLEQQIDEENRFQEDLNALHTMLDCPAPCRESELRPLWERLQRYRREIPEETEREALARLSAIEAGGRVRRRLALLAVLAAVALLAVALGIFAKWHKEQQRIAAVVTDTERYMGAGDFDAARTILDGFAQHEPELAADVRLHALGQRLDAARQKEAESWQRAEDAITAIENARDANFAEAARVPGMLEHAAGLARDEDQKLAVQELRLAWDEWRQQRRREVVARFNELTAEATRLEAMRATPPDDPRAVVPQVNATIAALAELRTSDHLPDTMREEVDRSRTALKDLVRHFGALQEERQAAARRQQQVAELAQEADGLATGPGDLDAYAFAIRKLAEIDGQNLVDNHTLDRLKLAATAALPDTAPANSPPLVRTELRLAAVGDASPWTRDLRWLRDYYQAIADKRDELRTLRANPEMTELKVFKWHDNWHYYLNGRREGTAYRVEALRWSPSGVRQARWGRVPIGEVQYWGTVMPHCQVVHDLLARLEAAGTDYPAVCIEAIPTLIDPQMNGIVKVLLIHLLWNHAAAALPDIVEADAKHLQGLPGEDELKVPPFALQEQRIQDLETRCNSAVASLRGVDWAPLTARMRAVHRLYDYAATRTLRFAGAVAVADGSGRLLVKPGAWPEYWSVGRDAAGHPQFFIVHPEPQAPVALPAYLEACGGPALPLLAPTAATEPPPMPVPPVPLPSSWPVARRGPDSWEPYRPPVIPPPE